MRIAGFGLLQHLRRRRRKCRAPGTRRIATRVVSAASITTLAKQLAFHRVNANVIVADRLRIDQAADDNPRAAEGMLVLEFAEHRADRFAAVRLHRRHQPLQFVAGIARRAEAGVIRLLRIRNIRIADLDAPASRHTGAAADPVEQHRGRPS